MAQKIIKLIQGDYIEKPDFALKSIGQSLPPTTGSCQISKESRLHISHMAWHVFLPSTRPHSTWRTQPTYTSQHKGWGRWAFRLRLVRDGEHPQPRELTRKELHEQVKAALKLVRYRYQSQSQQGPTGDTLGQMTRVNWAQEDQEISS